MNKKLFIGITILLILVSCIFLFFSESFSVIENMEDGKLNLNTKNKLCCIYAYYEKDKSVDSTCADNLNYFINNGLLDHVDYYFIINGEKCSVNIPNRPNIIKLTRENKGYDFGAYSYVLNKLEKNYDYYFFINTSVRGPFTEEKDWTKLFLDKFNDNVKIVGTSINVCPAENIFGHDPYELYGHPPPYTHIQSMIFCINSEYKNFLINNNFFNEEEINNMSFGEIIAKKEIGASQYALNNGWNINSIVPKFSDKDYSKIKIGFNPTSKDGEPYCTNCYFGKTITKEDVVFFKTNRELKI